MRLLFNLFLFLKIYNCHTVAASVFEAVAASVFEVVATGVLVFSGSRGLESLCS